MFVITTPGHPTLCLAFNEMVAHFHSLGAHSLQLIDEARTTWKGVAFDVHGSEMCADWSQKIIGVAKAMEA